MFDRLVAKNKELHIGMQKSEQKTAIAPLSLSFSFPPLLSLFPPTNKLIIFFCFAVSVDFLRTCIENNPCQQPATWRAKTES